jgi:hypothetical protein
MRRIGVFLLLSLALILIVPNSVAAQAGGGDGRSERDRSGFSLGQNYPNPFNPETRIPFSLGEDLFVNGESVVVSVRIYNMLQQFVAAPVALDHPSAGDLPLIDIAYTQPGDYVAFWDGKDQRGREVASGVYFVQMMVGGLVDIKRIVVAK